MVSFSFLTPSSSNLQHSFLHFIPTSKPPSPSGTLYKHTNWSCQEKRQPSAFDSVFCSIQSCSHSVPNKYTEVYINHRLVGLEVQASNQLVLTSYIICVIFQIWAVGKLKYNLYLQNNTPMFNNIHPHKVSENCKRGASRSTKLIVNFSFLVAIYF